MRASVVDQVDHSTGHQGWNKVEDRAVCSAMTDQPHRARATDSAGSKGRVDGDATLLVDDRLLPRLRGDAETNRWRGDDDATLARRGRGRHWRDERNRTGANGQETADEEACDTFRRAGGFSHDLSSADLLGRLRGETSDCSQALAAEVADRPRSATPSS